MSEFKQFEAGQAIIQGNSESILIVDSGFAGVELFSQTEVDEVISALEDLKDNLESI